LKAQPFSEIYYINAECIFSTLDNLIIGIAINEFSQLSTYISRNNSLFIHLLNKFFFF